MKTYTRAKFIGMARGANDKTYNYSKVMYSLMGTISENQEITIICPKHGDFKQTVKQHLVGTPYKCKECYKGKFPNAKPIYTFGVHKMGTNIFTSEK